jgi:soluble lytic murein transglycosylase-like protein
MYIKSMITRCVFTHIRTTLLCLLFSLLMSTTAQAEQVVSALSMKSDAAASPAVHPVVDPRLRQLLSDAINSSESFDDRFHAEVWLMDMSNRLERYVKDEELRLNMLKQIHLEATRADLQPELVLALIEIESHFDTYAISKSGAQGMMQVMPFWLDEIGRPDDNLIDMKTNLRMGCTILKYYMDMENNNLHRALARYNGSLGSRVYSDKVLIALRERWYKS